MKIGCRLSRLLKCIVFIFRKFLTGKNIRIGLESVCVINFILVFFMCDVEIYLITMILSDQ